MEPSLSLAYYTAYFGLETEEYELLHDIVVEREAFATAIADSVDYWNHAIAPRGPDPELCRLILRSHLVTKTAGCCVKSGVGIRLGMALSRIIADEAERIVRWESQISGGAR